MLWLTSYSDLINKYYRRKRSIYYLPLEALLCQSNTDPSDKLYLQNLSSVYFLIEVPWLKSDCPCKVLRDFQTEEEIDAHFDEQAQQARRFSRTAPAWLWEQTGSLKDFPALKRLSLGINLLMYFARGVTNDPTTPRGTVDLVDCLSDHLEYLCIQGYEKGKTQEHGD